MEDNRHNAQVERRMREAMKNDRARIQIGRISMFGLLELSRQRLRPSLIESNFSVCSACGGLGHVRSVESAALHVLRAVEEEGLLQKASELAVTVAEPVALYLLNHKRAALGDIERRYGIKVFVHSDTEIEKNADHKIERLKARVAGEFQFPEAPPAVVDPEDLLIDESDEDKFLDEGSSDSESIDGEGEAGNQTGEDGEGRGRSRGGRNSRGRGGRGRGEGRGNGRGGRGGERGPRDVSEPGAPQPEVMMPMLDADGNEIQPANLPSPDEQNAYVQMTGHGGEGQNGQRPPRAEGPDGRPRRRGRRGGRGRFREDRGPRDPNAVNAEGQPMVDGNVADGVEGQPREMATAEGGQMHNGEARAPRQPREGGEGRSRGGRGGRGRGPRREGQEQGGDRPQGDRPPREDRGPREPRNDRGPRQDRAPREHRLQDAPPSGGSSGGIKIISEFRGRNDAPSPHTSAPAPMPAPAAMSSHTDSPPTGDKPKSGWWKRLMG